MTHVVDAVIFDLDGVIVDSEPVWERVRREYVGEHSGAWQADSQRRLMGMSTAEWARYLSVELHVDRTPEQVAADVVAAMSRAYTRRVPLMAGAAEAVRRIGARWRLGLASSSPPSLISTALAAAGLDDAFDVVLSTEQMAHGKPAPDIYRSAAKGLGVDPAACVAVEDSANGVRSAAAAGMRVIAVPHPAYPLDAETSARASRTLASIALVTPELVDAVGAEH